MRSWDEIEACVARCHQRIESASTRIASASSQIETSRLHLDATILLIDAYEHPPHQPDDACARLVQAHIVENPRVLLQRIGQELWMYLSMEGDHYLHGWYLYYSLRDEQCSQLWGPFAAREQAEIYAWAYYWAMPQHFVNGVPHPAG